MILKNADFKTAVHFAICHLSPPALSDERVKQGLPYGCITLLCATQCRTHALAIYAFMTSNSSEF